MTQTKTKEEIKEKVESLIDDIVYYPYIKENYRKVDVKELVKLLNQQAKQEIIEDVLKEINKWYYTDKGNHKNYSFWDLEELKQKIMEMKK